MAYADAIRAAATATLDVIADLIDGIAGSAGPQVWAAWTPNVSTNAATGLVGTGTPTFGTLTTTARFSQMGKVVFCRISCTGTTGGSTVTRYQFDLPVSPQSAVRAGCVVWVGSGGQRSGTIVSDGGTSVTSYVDKYDQGDVGIGAVRGFAASFMYEAA